MQFRLFKNESSMKDQKNIRTPAGKTAIIQTSSWLLCVSLYTYIHIYIYTANITILP